MQERGASGQSKSATSLSSGQNPTLGDTRGDQNRRDNISAQAVSDYPQEGPEESC